MSINRAKRVKCGKLPSGRRLPRVFGDGGLEEARDHPRPGARLARRARGSPQEESAGRLLGACADPKPKLPAHGRGALEALFSAHDSDGGGGT